MVGERAGRQADLQAARLQFKEAVRQAEAGAVDVGLYGLAEALLLAPADLQRGGDLALPGDAGTVRNGGGVCPGGEVLGVVCRDNAVRLWDSATGLPLGPPLLHSAEVLAVGFTADAHLVTASAAGEVRRWPLPAAVPDDPGLLEQWLQAAGGRRLAGGETTLLDLASWQERREELRRRWPEGEAELARRHGASRGA